MEIDYHGHLIDDGEQSFIISSDLSYTSGRLPHVYLLHPSQLTVKQCYTVLKE